ncbi:TPA: YacL family protein [Proteus mirabilis]|nr:YacL family protein [Proteus mirabilis]MBG2905990.1 YacL family protein [Proteus mirabilis]MBG2927056.1 YacL family protein [Proteus mirabilis]MBG3022208.1 YacL family protein [Proteus mirabilis]HCD1094265.1 YacL family protein [Proteus mirabilis]
MDYEFQRDLTGGILARFSMDHEAIGYWLNDEIQGDISLIDQILTEMDEVKGSEKQWQLIGKEYSLSIDDEEIMVMANTLHFETDDLEEGMSYYDNESIAFCGLDDFATMLQKYRLFILENRRS